MFNALIPIKAYIGIGSNLDDRRENLKEAIRLIDKLDSTKVVKVSSFYKTSPVGGVTKEWFLNAVIEISTSFSPVKLMNSLIGIEEKLGRERREKWGDRIIDLDILFYGADIIDEAGINVPHKRLHERKFVLEPLNEIASEIIHPVLKKSISDLYDELISDEEVVKI